MHRGVKREVSTSFQDEDGGEKKAMQPTARPERPEESPTDELMKKLTELGEKSPREREILERSWGVGGKTYSTAEDIGKSLGISKQRVGQIERQARARLREQLSNNARALLDEIVLNAGRPETLVSNALRELDEVLNSNHEEER
jgi:DNA-directed RNA polymerase sigma subunit (sigma70/sigma32)